MLKVILFSVLENEKLHQISKGRDQLGTFFLKEIRCYHPPPLIYSNFLKTHADKSIMVIFLSLSPFIYFCDGVHAESY